MAKYGIDHGSILDVSWDGPLRYCRGNPKASMAMSLANLARAILFRIAGVIPVSQGGLDEARQFGEMFEVYMNAALDV